MSIVVGDVPGGEKTYHMHSRCNRRAGARRRIFDRQATFRVHSQPLRSAQVNVGFWLAALHVCRAVDMTTEVWRELEVVERGANKFLGTR